MKKLILLKSLVIATLFFSCSKDSLSNSGNELDNDLLVVYPNAQQIEWKTRSGYDVAEFHNGSLEMSAWFQNREWKITETDILYANLPQAVKEAFEASKYADWVVDEVELINRHLMEDIYIIEVKQGEIEGELHYSVDGILISVDTEVDLDDDHSDIIPDAGNEKITAYINQHFPNARIVEIDREDNTIEVGIIHNNRNKEVTFSNAYAWMHSEWDVTYAELPQAVQTAIKVPAYSGFIFDDAEYIQTPTQNYYEIELEQGDREVTLRIAKDGQILS